MPLRCCARVSRPHPTLPSVIDACCARVSRPRTRGDRKSRICRLPPTLPSRAAPLQSPLAPCRSLDNAALPSGGAVLPQALVGNAPPGQTVSIGRYESRTLLVDASGATVLRGSPDPAPVSGAWLDRESVAYFSRFGRGLGRPLRRPAVSFAASCRRGAPQPRRSHVAHAAAARCPTGACPAT